MPFDAGRTIGNWNFFGRRNREMHGKVYWNELNTWDAEPAKDYYSKVFECEFEEMPGKTGEPSYWLAKKNGEPVAGIFTLRSPDFDGMPSHWFTYFAVEDIEASHAANKKAGGHAANKKAGGKVFRGPFEIPNVGTMAVVRDSTGAGFAMMQPAQ
ncbi:MAG: VOC family protein [Hyphomicrobiales bacterium]